MHLDGKRETERTPEISTHPKRDPEAPPMTILHIDSSILGPNSVSRALTSEIVARQLALNSGAKVIYRDLEADAALHLSGAHLAVFQGGTVTNPALCADLAVGSAYLD